MDKKEILDILDNTKDERGAVPMRLVRQAFDKLVQPEQIWILCDERMPEEHEWIGTKKFGTTISDEVYVTFENSKGERFTKHLHFHNGELSRYDKTHMDAWYKDYKPIAWMPLPEPYKGSEQDE